MHLFCVRSRKVSALEDLIKAGLARAREDGSPYDYFRGRAMFPIFSTAGRVIGFGARKMREDDPVAGKYINSPETPIYNKSRVLFGLSHAKEAIRHEESVLMVEGYADLISLYQAGIQNVVASSGTALTEEQLTLIGHYTHNLTLIYDGDSAGSNATLRGIDLALAQDFDINIVELPEEEDPDSFVQKNGGNAFKELMKNAVSFIEFKTKKYLAAGVLATPAGKTNALRSIVQSIAKINDELKRNVFIKDVSDKFQIYESVLFRELEQRSFAGEKGIAPFLRNSALCRTKRAGKRPAGETCLSGSVGGRKGSSQNIPRWEFRSYTICSLSYRHRSNNRYARPHHSSACARYGG